MSSGSACWILWLTPMDWLALSIGRSGSQPLEYSTNAVCDEKCAKSNMKKSEKLIRDKRNKERNIKKMK